MNSSVPPQAGSTPSAMSAMSATDITIGRFEVSGIFDLQGG